MIGGAQATPAEPAGDDVCVARRIAGGDCAAFESLMRRHNRRLYRLARAALHDDAEAEDALQEAYLTAYRAMAQFRGESSLSTWLSRTVLNECLGRLRKSARRQYLVPMVAEDEQHPAPCDERAAPDHMLLRAQVRAIVERKLDALPEDFRIVFVLRAVEEMSVEETADVLGIPEATVRSRHFRARSLLRESLACEIDVAERDLFDFGGAHCDRIVAAVLQKLGR